MNTTDPAPTGTGLVWNVPNILTMARIALVPVFVVLMLMDSTASRWGALAVFVVAAITDRYDGHLARKHNLVTNFGKIADPFADKLLTGSAFVLLSWIGLLPWWVTAVILFREVAITILRQVMLRRAVMAASSGGKLKTVLQILGISILVLPWASFLDDAARWPVYIGQGVVYLALAVTVVTGVDYVLKALKIARSGS